VDGCSRTRSDRHLTGGAGLRAMRRVPVKPVPAGTPGDAGK
jgi:hypothetical protein